MPELLRAIAEHAAAAHGCTAVLHEVPPTLAADLLMAIALHAGRVWSAERPS